jgi:hypothetical protein
MLLSVQVRSSPLYYIYIIKLDTYLISYINQKINRTISGCLGIEIKDVNKCEKSWGNFVIHESPKKGNLE